jgi:hypothetical protein
MELTDCLDTRENDNYSINFHVFTMCTSPKNVKEAPRHTLEESLALAFF